MSEQSTPQPGESLEPAPDEEQVKIIEQTPQEVLDDDGGVEQPPQDPNLVIKSDEGAEG